MSSKHSAEQPKPIYHECWTIGDNQYGQQMDGTNKRVHKLQKVEILDKKIIIKDIISGNKGSVYLLCNDNKLIVCGQNEVGELGVFDTIIENIVLHWSQMKHKKMIVEIPNDVIVLIRQFTPKHIPDCISFISCPIMIRQFKINHISTGIAANHKFIINDMNQIYGFGTNQYRQISMKQDFGSKKEDSFTKIDYFSKNKISITQIACRYYGSMFLSDSSALYTCGNTEWKQQSMRQLDLFGNKIKKIACGYFHTVCIDINDNIIAFASEHFYYRRAPTRVSFFDDKQVQDVSCGALHTVVLTSDGKV